MFIHFNHCIKPVCTYSRYNLTVTYIYMLDDI